MAYQPAGTLTTSGSLAHLQVVHYTKVALDRLLPMWLFRSVCQKETLGKGNGRTIQWFRYGQATTNTATLAEGTVGSPVTTSTKILQAQLSQYGDFMSLSDFLVETAPDAIVENHSMLLGERAGATVDLITRAVIDAEAASCNQAALSTYATVRDLRAYRHNLRAVNVQPYEDGAFKVLMHPYCTYDVVNDPAAGGLGDIVKYTSPKDSALIKYAASGDLGIFGGCRLQESTTVYSETTGGVNYWRAYAFGKGAVGSVDLEGAGPSNITDPSKERFSVKVKRYSGELADPVGVIAATVSYNFKTTTVVLEGPATIGGTYRMRQTLFASTIA